MVNPIKIILKPGDNLLKIVRDLKGKPALFEVGLGLSVDAMTGDIYEDKANQSQSLETDKS